MDETPLVSVIIPVYNAEKTIVDCINSVLVQTYGNIEIIVVNDGSKDNTEQIIWDTKWGENNIYVYTIENSGPAAARNYGVQHSKGKYIAFLDSDDTWLPKKIELQVHCFLQNSAIDLVGCKWAIGSTVDVPICGEVVPISRYRLLFKNDFRPTSVMLKRSLWTDFQFNENKRYSEDYLLWLQIAFNNHKLALQKDVLVRLCDKPLWGAAGLSANLWKMEKSELNNFKILHETGKISCFLYWIVSAFSMMKHVRRVIITRFRKL